MSGREWRKPHFIKNPVLRWGLLIATIVYLYLALNSIEVNWTRVSEGLVRGWEFVKAFASPDFVSRWGDIRDGMVESIIITIASTVVGILISIPIGLGAARNIAPLPVYLICRAIVAVSRALNEIIVAILMVAIFGFGPLAGFITLSFATIGFLSKLLAEDIEDLDRVQAEAIRSTGSSWLQWINYGVQPQVMPRLIGLSIYRLDINFRESAVLGLVGAGGIGATLNTAFDRYEFDTAAAILLIIIVIVMGLEYISGVVRARVPVVPVVESSNGPAGWKLHTGRQSIVRWLCYLAGVSIFMYCWKVISDATTWFFVWDAPRIANDIGSRALPPKWSYIEKLWIPIWDTLNMATLGTILALLMAVPVAFLAARNTTPSTVFVRPVALLIIVATRSINSLIWALLLVAIIGPGVLAGTIAIAIRSIGFCAKLLYEAIEEIDTRQVEAVTATGASRWQIMAYAIAPQIAPAFAGISVFRWDINIRESTVLGLVGAGGIGLQLQGSLNTLAWNQVSLILLVILFAVVVGEWISAKVRGAII